MTCVSPSTAKLAVVDFSQEDLKPGTSSWLASCKQVVSALKEYGCFMVKYDKQVSMLHDALFSVLEEIFDLPVKTKRKNVSDVPFFAYLESHPVFRPLFQEGFKIPEATTLQGTQNCVDAMWPEGNHRTCKTILAYTRAVAEWEEMVMKMVFGGYGVGNHHFESRKESTDYLFRMMKYRVPKKDEVKVGSVCHKDMDFLSVLDQNQVNGLEIKPKDGQWFSIDYKPWTLFVMAGEPLMAWSNGRIHAVEHRVMINGNKERYSVGLLSYSNKGMVEVPEELVDDEHPLQFKPYNYYDDMKRNFLKTIYANEDCSLKAYCGV